MLGSYNSRFPPLRSPVSLSLSLSLRTGWVHGNKYQFFKKQPRFELRYEQLSLRTTPAKGAWQDKQDTI